jgi:hypothetical protein
MVLGVARTSLCLWVVALCAVVPLQGQEPAPVPEPGQGVQPRQVFSSAQTDVLILRNGDVMTGEFKSMQRGMVTFKTDAASTISVKWPRVITAWTDKQFEIRLEDSRIFVGTMAGTDSGHVVIQGASDTVSVPTETVVAMVRLKRNFFSRLDGNINLGLNYTQQNNKVDINASGQVRYNIPLNHFVLNINATFSRQDSISNITRRNFTFFYARELSTRKDWIWVATAGNQENSQLGLDNAISLGTGPGRIVIQSNRVDLIFWVAPAIRREDYGANPPRTVYPLSFVGDFQLFSWAGMSTDLSSRLSAGPVLNDSNRWQISFTANLNRELLNQLYLTIGITEIYDSNPPFDTNKNDFSLTTSLGWTF